MRSGATGLARDRPFGAIIPAGPPADEPADPEQQLRHWGRVAGQVAGGHDLEQRREVPGAAVRGKGPDIRQALLEEMLATWEKTGTEDIIARVESQPGDARAKLQKLFEVTSWPEGLAVELAVRDWSRRDSDVARRLRRVDNRRLEFVRSLFRQFVPDEEDVEIRSMLAYSAVIGSYFVAADHRDMTRSQVLQLALDHLLR